MELFIYSVDGHFMYNITITEDVGLLGDAIWTFRGNIIVSAGYTNRVARLSESGKVLNILSNIKDPVGLSISSDGKIYLAARANGIYQSTNDGISWTLSFQLTDGFQFWYVAIVATEYGDDFWSLGIDDKRLDGASNNLGLRIFSVKATGGNVTWRDLTFKEAIGRPIDFGISRLLYDDIGNIFASEFAPRNIHVLSANGLYRTNLLSFYGFAKPPTSMALDCVQQKLYVGQEEGVVSLFNLTYENEVVK